MGQQAGMATALMLTGATTRTQAQVAENAPDFILDSLAELPGILGVVSVRG